MGESDPEHAVFLSGNGPLVKELTEALALDQIDQMRDLPRSQRPRKSAARRRASTFIQIIHHFRDEYLKSKLPPVDHVVVFDEAQRAWNRDQTSKFMLRKKRVKDFDMSEPEFLLSVMDRHQDWCCVVCLVGGGEDINIGEAGMSEWLSALRNKFSSWTVYCSDQMNSSEYSWDTDLRTQLEAVGAHIESDLHLRVSLRSFRSENVSSFVSSVIAGDSTAALGLQNDLSNYPLALTRNIEDARAWVREKARGTERYGLLASSNAIRLKPEGIYVQQDVEPANWFLKGKEDIRSSFYLEDVATEFDVQGLELDWAIVCWDANFRRVNGQWVVHNFSGTRWQTVHNESQKRYVANAYRVLLTRARQGLIVFVPRGDPEDPSRPPSFYDGIYSFLSDCGIRELGSTN
jgi:hypothetical protein